MRALRTTIVLLLAVTAFTACKKGGGYLQPAPVPSNGFTR
jgi:predicted small lipoprotein YifL